MADLLIFVKNLIKGKGSSCVLDRHFGLELLFDPTNAIISINITKIVKKCVLVIGNS